MYLEIYKIFVFTIYNERPISRTAGPCKSLDRQVTLNMHCQYLFFSDSQDEPQSLTHEEQRNDDEVIGSSGKIPLFVFLQNH